MTDWEDRRRWMVEARLGFMVHKPTCHVHITGIETMTPQQIMDELREKDPAAHARLSEIVVLDENGQVTRESVALLHAAIEAAT